MKFSKTLTYLNSPFRDEVLHAELQSNVFVTDFHQLTRCGGHVSDQELNSIQNVSLTSSELVVLIQIQFSDGAAIDCSGHCGGEVVRRKEILKIRINRETGKADWQTLDGVVSGV